MELDELKNIWQQASKESISSQIVHDDELSLMIRRKSKDAVSKLKRNMVLESILGLLFFPFFTYIILLPNVASLHKYICGILFLVTAITLGFFWFEYRRLERFDTNVDLMTSLRSTVKQLSKFIRIYLIFNYILLFPMMFYGSLVGLEVSGNEIAPKYLIINAIVTILISPLGYWWVKFYLRKVYQQHLEKLRNCLTELEESIE